MRRFLMISAAVALLLATPSVANAQTTILAPEIIQALKPMRGLRPASQNLTVLFANGSAGLTPQAGRALEELGKALTSQELSGYRFRIEGHTDTVGAPELNKTLSAKRAEAVVAYLKSKFGIPPARLEAVGKGDSDLLVATPPQTAEPRNRRVQVVNIGS